MKQFFFYFVVFSATLLFISCDRDDDDSSEKQFFTVTPTYDGQALQTSKEYPYGADEFITFTRLKLFISDLVISQNGEEIVNIPINDFDFGSDFSTLNKAEEGLSTEFNALDPGTYQLSFGIGVNQETNAKSPSDFSVSHPLGQGTEYWGPWESYIFTKHEGFHRATETVSFAYHTGSNDCYTTFSQEIEWKASYNEIVLNIDYADIFFEEDGSLKDIPAEPMLHNLSQTDLAVMFCTNINASSTIEYR